MLNTRLLLTNCRWRQQQQQQLSTLMTIALLLVTLVGLALAGSGGKVSSKVGINESRLKNGNGSDTVKLSVKNARHRRALVFDVGNGEEFCFHHEFTSTLQYLFEYGVVKGGNLDIDFRLETSSGTRIYARERTVRSDAFLFTGSLGAGHHKFCFGNSFSPLSSKLVYFDVKPNDPRALDTLEEEANGASGVPKVMSHVEFQCNQIHALMRNVSAVQAFYRHHEAADKHFADDIEFKVTLLSALQFAAILLLSQIQVFVVKRFFSRRHFVTSDKSLMRGTAGVNIAPSGNQAKASQPPSVASSSAEALTPMAPQYGGRFAQPPRT